MRRRIPKSFPPFLKLARNAEGFFVEAHVKLRPVDMATEGIFVCGTAHSPKLISESIAQALAAAARAATFLVQGRADPLCGDGGGGGRKMRLLPGLRAVLSVTGCRKSTKRASAKSMRPCATAAVSVPRNVRPRPLNSTGMRMIRSSAKWKRYWRGCYESGVFTDHHRVLLQFLRVFRCGPGRFDEAEVPGERQDRSGSLHRQGGCDHIFCGLLKKERTVPMWWDAWRGIAISTRVIFGRESGWRRSGEFSIPSASAGERVRCITSHPAKRRIL